MATDIITEKRPIDDLLNADLAYENIRKKLEIHGLYRFINKISLKLEDRFFFVANSGNSLEVALRSAGMKREWSSGGPHKQIYSLHPKIALIQHPMYSWREQKRPSLQVTTVMDSRGVIYGDADIDLSSPFMDVVGFFTHLMEVIVPGKTDHKKLAKRVDKEYEKWLKRRA